MAHFCDADRLSWDVRWRRAKCGRKTLIGNSSHLNATIPEIKDIAIVRHVTKCHMMDCFKQKQKQNLPVATDSHVAVIFYLWKSRAQI